MCGRFTLRTPAGDLARHFDCAFDPLSARFNIAPTQIVTAVRREDAESPRRLDRLRWGLVPSWAKDPSIGNRMINARAETVAEKPAFRVALRRRRCLIPADGYYEWLKQGTAKQPFCFHLRDNGPFAFAGLWEIWRGGTEDEPVRSCTIITTEASQLARPIHDRMPAILEPADYAAWLDPTLQDPASLKPLLHPFESPQLVVHPVSTFVNRPQNDDPRCVEPVQA
jgi:putative SOS response-associated peptidase YedK